MPVISARNLSKAYGAEQLLGDVSLTIENGERVGLLGRNGAGKSTLLRILAAVETADAGVVERQRDSKILYLSQEPRFDPEATPRQLLEEGLTEWSAAFKRHSQLTELIAGGASDAALVEEQARLAEQIEHLGGWERGHVIDTMLERLGILEPDRAIGTMSGGEQRRVALARLLVSEPDLAILDEPTNHLDADTIEWLEQYLVESFRGAVLLVTHDRYVLDAICERIFELENGTALEYRGSYSDYLQQKAELEAHAERVESNRLNLLRREQAWLLRGAKARTTKQKARIDRAQALMAAAAPKALEQVSLEAFAHSAPRTGKSILDFHELRVTLGGRTLVSDLTLRMVPGDRIGIIGRNGMGKTSLLRVVTGELEPSGGRAVVGQNTRFTLFDQARANLQDDWSVFDNVAGREGAERSGAAVVQIGERTYELRSYLEQFLFRGSEQRQKVGSLSGGERARVALAKALSSGSNLLLLDEPTNDLDIPTLNAIEQLLDSWPGCVIVVSHDRYFLDRVATSILAFEGQGAVVQYPGGYASYRSLRDQAELQRQQQAKLAPAPPEPRVKRRTSEPNPNKPLSYSERKELDGLLERVSEAEDELRRLEAELASPKAYADADTAKRLKQDYDAARGQVDALTARWEELERRRELSS